MPCVKEGLSTVPASAASTTRSTASAGGNPPEDEDDDETSTVVVDVVVDEPVEDVVVCEVVVVVVASATATTASDPVANGTHVSLPPATSSAVVQAVTASTDGAGSVAGMVNQPTRRPYSKAQSVELSPPAWSSQANADPFRFWSSADTPTVDPATAWVGSKLKVARDGDVVPVDDEVEPLVDVDATDDVVALVSGTLLVVGCALLARVFIASDAIALRTPTSASDAMRSMVLRSDTRSGSGRWREKATPTTFHVPRRPRRLRRSRITTTVDTRHMCFRWDDQQDH
jgi:hypothetical protein